MEFLLFRTICSLCSDRDTSCNKISKWFSRWLFTIWLTYIVNFLHTPRWSYTAKYETFLRPKRTALRSRAAQVVAALWLTDPLLELDAGGVLVLDGYCFIYLWKYTKRNVVDRPVGSGAAWRRSPHQKFAGREREKRKKRKERKMRGKGKERGEKGRKRRGEHEGKMYCGYKTSPSSCQKIIKTQKKGDRGEKSPGGKDVRRARNGRRKYSDRRQIEMWQ